MRGAGADDEKRAVEELALVRQALEGRPEAFRTIVDTHHGAVYGLSLSLLGDRQEAEDVVQEAFLRLYRHLGDYRPGRKLANWLYTIALNLSRNRLRRRKVLRFFSLEAWTAGGAEARAGGPGVEERLVREEESLALERRIAALPDALREPLVLRYAREMSDEDIAEVLGISVSNVRVRVHRAKARLWQSLAEGRRKED